MFPTVLPLNRKLSRAAHQQILLWALPPEGGTTNTAKPVENVFVVPASPRSAVAAQREGESQNLSRLASIMRIAGGSRAHTGLNEARRIDPGMVNRDRPG